MELTIKGGHSPSAGPVTSRDPASGRPQCAAIVEKPAATLAVSRFPVCNHAQDEERYVQTQDSGVTPSTDSGLS